jgi:hypothetical protein
MIDMIHFMPGCPAEDFPWAPERTVFSIYLTAPSQIAYGSFKDIGWFSAECFQAGFLIPYRIKSFRQRA